MEEDQITYQEFIERITEERGKHGCGNEYHEKHHIIPKCLGGSNDKENLIDLFAREHFVAHKLLAKENPHNSKLQFAWWCMSSMKNEQQERYQCTPEEYEEAKKAMASAVTKNNYENHWDCSGEKHPLYGKHHSEETKRKISNSMLGHETSEDTRKKLSEAAKGQNNSMYGKHFPVESRKKMSKPILCVETGVIYYGVKEATRQTGINQGNITACCRGKRRVAGGYHWEYVKEEKETAS